MPEQSIRSLERSGVADLLVALVDGDGTGGNAYAASPALRSDPDTGRNLADALHYLSVLHGHLPGMLDHAADRNTAPAAFDWYAQATAGFRVEREYLARIAAAAGPLPSTPGQAQSESAVTGQRHALEMLARSERRGTALGAAIALVLDWQAIRRLLDRAAGRFDLKTPPCRLPQAEENLRVAEAVADTAAVERALSFGAQQTLLQHRGLWDLLEARRLARRDS